MKSQQDLTNFDKEMGAEDRLSAPPDFDGPVKERKVTDPLCLLLLLFSWAAMTYLGVWAFQGGDVYNLVKPKDYLARNCGADTDESGTVLSEKWVLVDQALNGVCRDTCPNSTIFNPVDKSELICKDEETISSMELCNNVTDASLLVLCGACFYQVESTDVYDVCVPNDIDAIEETLSLVESNMNLQTEDRFSGKILGKNAMYIEKFARDVWVSVYMVLGIGIGGATILGLLFLVLLRSPGFVYITVWTSAISIPIILAGIGYGFHELKNYYEENPEEIQHVSNDNVNLAVQISSYVFYALAGFVLLLLIALRKRIALAIGITKAAARSVMSVPLTIFYPIVQVIGFCSFMAPWCAYFLFLSATGTTTSTTVELYGIYPVTYNKYAFSNEASYGFWYLLFCLYWTSQFIVALGQISLSMCYSKWYFTVDKDDGVDITVAKATGITICKHTGTAAFGSLVIAIIQLLRSFVLWTQKKIKQAGADNKCVDVVICCCQCCLFCLERCMKFVSKNAYIQTAIFGHSFCKGAHEAFFLILRNAARMAAVGIVSELSMVFCKFFIIFGCALSAFYGIQEVYGSEVSSVGGLAVAVGFLAWFIGDMFTEVLGIAVSTIFQCFIADEEMFSRTGSYYVPEELDDFLKSLDEDNEQRAIKSYKKDEIEE